MNGLGRMVRANFRPVQLTGIYTDGTGTTVYAATVELRVTPYLSVDGVGHNGSGATPSPPQLPPGPERIALAQRNPDVAEALEILGQRDDTNWIALYKVHEIIRVSIQPQKILQLGWADKLTDSAFRASANLPGVSGAGAGHARKPGAPKETMTLGEGRSYINDLVRQWLDWLAQR